MAVFPTLDFLQVKARYPKAVKKITDWLFDQEDLRSVTGDFIDPKDPEGAKEQFAGLLIQMDPRKLYDIFDALGILMVVSFEVQAPQQWSHLAVNFRSTESGIFGYCSDRHGAEQTGFHDAFELLEKQL